MVMLEFRSLNGEHLHTHVLDPEDARILQMILISPAYSDTDGYIEGGNLEFANDYLMNLAKPTIKRLCKHYKCTKEEIFIFAQIPNHFCFDTL